MCDSFAVPYMFAHISQYQNLRSSYPQPAAEAILVAEICCSCWKMVKGWSLQLCPELGHSKTWIRSWSYYSIGRVKWNIGNWHSQMYRPTNCPSLQWITGLSHCKILWAVYALPLCTKTFSPGLLSPMSQWHTWTTLWLIATVTPNVVGVKAYYSLTYVQVHGFTICWSQEWLLPHYSPLVLLILDFLKHQEVELKQSHHTILHNSIVPRSTLPCGQDPNLIFLTGKLYSAKVPPSIN